MLDHKMFWKGLKFSLKPGIYSCLYECMYLCEKIGHDHSMTEDSYSMTVSNISLEATGLIVAKFHIDPSGVEGTKICGQKFVI